jgi:hypothetical protein
MPGKTRSAKDAATAAMLKKLGVVRTTGRCAICHHIVSLAHYVTHLHVCQGRQKVVVNRKRRA